MSIIYISDNVRKFAKDSYTKMRILELHYDSYYPPSLIDKTLKLIKGTAHDVMVEWWKFEKNGNNNQ